MDGFLLPCTSASSIKTRIKTVNLAIIKDSKVVRVHHPLKQGLRQDDNYRFRRILRVRVHHPLKQGLRHLQFSVDHDFACSVRVHHPLKQGLRREHCETPR